MQSWFFWQTRERLLITLHTYRTREKWPAEPVARSVVVCFSTLHKSKAPESGDGRECKKWPATYGNACRILWIRRHAAEKNIMRVCCCWRAERRECPCAFCRWSAKHEFARCTETKLHVAVATAYISRLHSDDCFLHTFTMLGNKPKCA